MVKYKIWWQSSVQLNVLPGYKEAIEAHAKRILGDDFEVEMQSLISFTSSTHALKQGKKNLFTGRIQTRAAPPMALRPATEPPDFLRLYD